MNILKLIFSIFNHFFKLNNEKLFLRKFIYLSISLSLISSPARSTMQMLVPSSQANNSKPLILEFLINPAANTNLKKQSIEIPENLLLNVHQAGLTNQTTIKTIPMELVDKNKKLSRHQRGFTKVRYSGHWPKEINGLVNISIQNTDFPPITIMVNQGLTVPNNLAQLENRSLQLQNESLVTTATRDSPQNKINEQTDDDNLPRFKNLARQHMFSYYPMYFGIGHNNTTSAQFQFSFQYRIYAPEDITSKNLFKNLYFAYTQTSLWDLSAFSKPFKDSSYKPAFFYYVPDFGFRNSWLKSVGLRTGFEHESNGRNGIESRSLNILFAEPIFKFSAFGDDTFSFAPKLIYYLEKSENPDITHYRGYADFVLRYHRHSNWYLTTTIRKGTDKFKGSINAQLSYPLSKLLNKKMGGYLWVSYFNGYGETLLDYNKRNRWIARIGYSLVP